MSAGMKQQSVPGALRKARDALLDILYPEEAVCRACGAIASGGCLCRRCREELHDTGFAFSWEVTEVDGVQAWSLRPYGGVAKQLVIRLKHGAEACLARELASLVHPLPAVPRFAPDTVVTWVPMPEARKRERCIDHGERLARAVAEELGLCCRPLLRRTNQKGPTQATLNREQREKNLKGAFSPVETFCFPVLLVDDVLTTGTTARRCIEALRQGGAADISILAVTRTQRNPSQ